MYICSWLPFIFLVGPSSARLFVSVPISSQVFCHPSPSSLAARKLSLQLKLSSSALSLARLNR